MFLKFRIGTKFRLSLVLFFVAGILSTSLSATLFQERAQAKVINTAYTQEQKIAERLVEQLRKHPEIHPEIKNVDFRRPLEGRSVALVNYQCAGCHALTPRSPSRNLAALGGTIRSIKSN